MVKGWSGRASGRISPFSFSSLWGQHTPQPWRRGPKKPSSVCRSLPGIHFIVSMTLSPDKGKQLRQETGCFQMRKPKKERDGRETWYVFRTSSASSASPTPLPPLNPSIVSWPQIPHFAWKSREETRLKYTLEFLGAVWECPELFELYSVLNVVTYKSELRRTDTVHPAHMCDCLLCPFFCDMVLNPGERSLNAVMLHFSSGVLRLCNQPLFTFTAKVNYRFQWAAWRGSGSQTKMPDCESRARRCFLNSLESFFNCLRRFFISPFLL